MAKTSKLDLAKADKEALLDFIEKSGTTVDPALPVPQLREKAMEIQQEISSMKDDDDLEARAKAAADAVLGNDGDETSDDGTDSDDEPEILSQMKGSKKASKSYDIESLDVHPHDGESESIHNVIDDSRRSRDGSLDETIEEKILREQQDKRDSLRTAREVAAADAQIREYHINAMDKHGAKKTDVCFFLLKGTYLNTFSTPYTKIPGVRLRKQTPYRALDIELKFFRRKRGMFGECGYQGSDKVSA